MTNVLQEAEQLIKSADPQQALAKLTQAVKSNPADANLRIFLAQLLCVAGQWERAHTQLNVCADMTPKAIPMREMAGHAIRCELLRNSVFSGSKAPMVFGQPESWLALLIESLLQSHSKTEDSKNLSDHLADRAFSEAPTVSGTINGDPFEWLADADSRLGPVLEAHVNGKYYWIPFNRISSLKMEAPSDLRDFVWMPAQITFSNGGQQVAMIPTRYPGTEQVTDGNLLLSRKTEWISCGKDRWAGVGQRVWATDSSEYDFLSIREVILHSEDNTFAEPEAVGDA